MEKQRCVRSRQFAVTEEVQLEPAVVAALYEEHAGELRRFLFGVLRDDALTSDVLQATFIRLMEVGHRSKEETRKAWLFRVAYREALTIRRREATGERAIVQKTWLQLAAGSAEIDPLILEETKKQIKFALAQLPAEQAVIVKMRIYEEKKFAVIAKELNIPLGTALARMQSALKKLRTSLAAEQTLEDESKVKRSLK